MAMLAGFFGGLAGLLAVIGLYGILSYMVARRRSEIGIRMALGADRRIVTRLVVREALKLLVVGLAIGAALAAAAARSARSLLFGLEPGDPATMIGAIVGLAVVAVLAAYWPARRAARLNPVMALREEWGWTLRSIVTIRKGYPCKKRLPGRALRAACKEGPRHEAQPIPGTYAQCAAVDGRDGTDAHDAGGAANAPENAGHEGGRLHRQGSEAERVSARACDRPREERGYAAHVPDSGPDGGSGLRKPGQCEGRDDGSGRDQAGANPAAGWQG